MKQDNTILDFGFWILDWLNLNSLSLHRKNPVFILKIPVNPVYCIFILLLCGARGAGADAAAFDPRAVSLLERMTAAYGRLRALDQRTEFYSEMIPFDQPDSPFGIPKQPTENPDSAGKADAKPDAAGTNGAKPDSKNKPVKSGRRLSMRYAFPNRLRLEMSEAEPGSETPTRHLWDSDGKFFWTTIPEKNWYTRDKAPAHLADFRKLKQMDANSLEMLMLLGVNPFAKLREQCDRLTWEGAATARDIAVDVVALRTEAREGDTVAKLYIGHDDFLLRRVVIETTPAVGPATPGKIGDALDELAPEEPNPTPAPFDPSAPLNAPANLSGDAPALLDAPPLPAPPAGAKPMKTRLTYDNIITLNPAFDYDAFAFAIPENALLYNDPDQNKAKKRKPANLMRRRKKYRVINP